MTEWLSWTSLTTVAWTNRAGAKGPRDVRRQRAGVVFHVCEDVGTGLQFVQGAVAVVDVVGPCPAAGDERRRQARVRERCDRFADARTLRLHRFAAFVEAGNVLQMAIIGL